MASLLIGATILSYTTIQKSRAKRAQKRASANTRFSELERDNAVRIARLQSTTCFCQSGDWQGGGCDVHGFVPEAGEGGGLPGYEEEGVGDGGGGGGVGEEEEAPAYDGAQDAGGREVVGAMREGGRGGGETYPDLRWRGEEDGALAGHKQAEPGPMGEEEVRRINEERRKRVKAGGFTNWVLRRKGGRREGDGVGVGVVR